MGTRHQINPILWDEIKRYSLDSSKYFVEMNLFRLLLLIQWSTSSGIFIHITPSVLNGFLWLVYPNKYQGGPNLRPFRRWKYQNKSCSQHSSNLFIYYHQEHSNHQRTCWSPRYPLVTGSLTQMTFSKRPSSLAGIPGLLLPISPHWHREMSR